MPIQNKTITTGGVSEVIFPAFHGNGGFIITPLDEDMWINFANDAGVNAGEKVFQNSPARFSYQNFPELNARVSVYSATTGAKYTLRFIS